MVLCHNVVMTLQTLKNGVRMQNFIFQNKIGIIFEYLEFLSCKKGKSVLLSLETQITHATRFISSDRMSFSLQLFYLCKLLPKNFLKTYYSRIIMRNKNATFSVLTHTEYMKTLLFLQQKVFKSIIYLFSCLRYQIFHIIYHIINLI